MLKINIGAGDHESAITKLTGILYGNCRKTLQDITATLNEGTPVKISHSTVRRRLSFFGYKRRIVKKKIIVSNVNRFKRRAMVQVKATLYG
jgi:hypothetical protein